jgi:hypothetical protein
MQPLVSIVLLGLFFAHVCSFSVLLQITEKAAPSTFAEERVRMQIMCLSLITLSQVGLCVGQ